MTNYTPIAINNKPTNSMVHNTSSETNKASDNQEFPHMLLNPNFHYRIRNSPPLAPVLSFTNPAHIVPSYYYEDPLYHPPI
jgi:hypothetical protein